MTGDGRRFSDIARAFTKLGLTSFGGPIAHLGYFRTEFVERRQWLNDAAFADLIALCQFLPGPASSQVVFAIGMLRGGLIGGMIASVCFTMPSVILMIAFAYGVAGGGDLSHAGWLLGLKLAAVAVVAQAVWGMAARLCPDKPRATLCLAAAAILLLISGPWIQVLVIGSGALAGWLIYRRDVANVQVDEPAAPAHVRHVAIGALVLFFAILLLSPLVARLVPTRPVLLFDSFFRSGALVFGGGHVVLPLLQAETVPRGWLTNDAFLAGYGAVQAVPGPLFTFAAYLGTAIAKGPLAWLNGLWCAAAIFFPSWLLVAGALPFWHQLRGRAWIQAALRGANAVVVGLLLAALYRPVITDSVRGPRDVAMVLLAFAGLHLWRVPPWLVVAGMALLGQLVGA